MSDLEANLSVEEAAAILFGSTDEDAPKKLTRLATGPRPRIGSLVIGRTRVYPPQVIADFIESNTIPAAKPNPWGLTDSSARRVRKAG